MGTDDEADLLVSFEVCDISSAEDVQHSPVSSAMKVHISHAYKSTDLTSEHTCFTWNPRVIFLLL